MWELERNTDMSCRGNLMDGSAANLCAQREKATCVHFHRGGRVFVPFFSSNVRVASCGTVGHRTSADTDQQKLKSVRDEQVLRVSMRDDKSLIGNVLRSVSASPRYASLWEQNTQVTSLSLHACNGSSSVDSCPTISNAHMPVTRLPNGSASQSPACTDHPMFPMRFASVFVNISCCLSTVFQV